METSPARDWQTPRGSDAELITPVQPRRDEEGGSNYRVIIQPLL